MIVTLLIVVFGVFAASVLRGFTGFGFGIAAVPLLSLALPPAKAVPFVVALQAIVGLAGFRRAWRQCDWRAVRGLTPGLFLGIPIGLMVLTAFSPNTVRLAIGLVITVSVLLLWRGAQLPPHPSRLLTWFVGLLSGVISGLASMGGPPIVVFLLALGHTATVVRATSIVYFMISALLSLIGMTWRGLLDREIIIWAAASIPVLLIGTWAGSWGFRHAQPHHHRMTALVVLAILALTLIGRALLPT
jgi:uncharacterized membrane protein YfcA